MKTWSREKLKEFWMNIVGMLVGISAIVMVSLIYYNIPVDFVAVYSGLLYNFEYSYVAAGLNALLIGTGVFGGKMLFSETKCCIKVIKTGNCL